MHSKEKPDKRLNQYNLYWFNLCSVNTICSNVLLTFSGTIAVSIGCYLGFGLFFICYSSELAELCSSDCD